VRPDHAIAFLIFLAVLLAAAAGGAAIDRKLFRDDAQVVHEAPAAGEDLGDSTLLPRDPKADLPAKPPAAPKGHTPVRDTTITVRPPPVEIICSDGETTKAVCLDVTVGFRLLRNDADGTYRVQGYSPDGEVLGGIDVPRVPALVPIKRNSSLGVTAFASGAQLIRYGHRFDRLKVSAELLAPDGFDGPATDLTPGAGIEWSW